MELCSNFCKFLKFATILIIQFFTLENVHTDLNEFLIHYLLNFLQPIIGDMVDKENAPSPLQTKAKQFQNTGNERMKQPLRTANVN